MEAYCVKCREKRPIAAPKEETMKKSDQRIIDTRREVRPTRRRIAARAKEMMRTVGRREVRRYYRDLVNHA